jgi:hypothetical protein
MRAECDHDENAWSRLGGVQWLHDPRLDFRDWEPRRSHGASGARDALADVPGGARSPRRRGAG